MKLFFLFFLILSSLYSIEITIKDLSFLTSKQTKKTVVLPSDLDLKMTFFSTNDTTDYYSLLIDFSLANSLKIKDTQTHIILSKVDSKSSDFLSSNDTFLPPPSSFPVDTSNSMNLTKDGQVISSFPLNVPSNDVKFDNNCTFSHQKLNFVEIKDIQDLLDFSKLNYKLLVESSTIVFCTSANDDTRLKSLQSLISEVDKPNDQIAIKITIAEINQNKLEDFGLTPNLKFDFSMISKSGSLFTGDAVGNFYSSLTFLKNEGVSTVSNSTEYFLTNGKKFNFSDSTTLPFIDENFVSTNLTTNQSKRYKYKDVGYTLAINPKILGDQVQLDFDLKFENVVSNTDNLPVTAGKKISTTFSAKTGDLIVLAGIKKANNLISEDTTPVYIPLISDIFQHQKTTDSDITLSISIEILHIKNIKKEVL